MIPVIPRLQGELGILTGDRESQVLFRNRVFADRCAKIRARQQGALALIFEDVRLDGER